MRLFTSLLLLLALPLPAVADGRWDKEREEIALLASADELAAFDVLAEDYRREAFLRQFWSLRDPFPATARNELRERWQERAAIARDRWASLADDRSRLLLLHGEPAEVLTPRCGGLLRRLELWSWPRSELVASPFVIVVELIGGGEQTTGRVFDPIAGLGALGFGSASLDEAAFAERLLGECAGGSRVLDFLGRAVRWPLDGPDRRSWPTPDPEWVLAFADRSTNLGADVAPLEHLGVELSFPARRQSRTVLRALLTLPTSSATATAGVAIRGQPGVPVTPQPPAYRYLVDGEVLRDGVLFDSFRYRFELPANVVGETLAIPIERALRPAAYTFALRVRELAQPARETRFEQAIVVPATISEAAATPVVAADPAPEGGDPTSPTAHAVPAALESVVRLLAPSPELTSGLTRVGAVVEGPPIAGLRFTLDGKPLLTRKSPPWTVEIDLGRIPKTRRLEAFALDRNGNVLAADAVLLNAGPHRFAIRIVEPSRGSATGTAVRVAAEVEVPEGEELDRVEIFLGNNLVATLFQPPFEQRLDLPRLEELAWVRAVAHLHNGAAAEDIVFVNAPDLIDSLDVDFVELYTTVVDKKGKPVEGLARDAFKVREDGRDQVVRRFELIRDTPLHAGIVLDVSSSMREELADAVSAALAFFADLLRPTDRACVVTFSDHPELRVRFTNDLGVLAGGLAGVSADGNTALWDTVVYSLFYFNGIRGKRAIVLVSDGEDSGSRHGFEEALEFAQRSGVAIYTVSLGRVAQQSQARSLLIRLAEDTGGRFFTVASARELSGVYAKIDEELRSQYLLAYQSDATAGGYREVEVKVEGERLEARTIRGYFP